MNEGEAGRFECPVCHRRFTRLAVKKQHIKTEHGKKVTA